MKRWGLIAFLLGWTHAVVAADVPAVLYWSQRVELSPPVSGIVQTVNVEAGQQVKKGQVLLSLDNVAFQARLAESGAAINRYREEAADAKRELERAQELYNRTVLATTELDQAKLRQSRAQSQLSEAEARLKQNSKYLDDTFLRAPFDALVVSRMVEPGQAVASGLQPQPLLVLAKSGEMLARAKLSVEQIEKLKIGQMVTVETGQHSYSGRIKTLGLEPLAKDAGLYPVDVVFPVKIPLRAGLPGVLKLP